MKNILLAVSIIIFIASGLLFLYTYSQTQASESLWSNSILNSSYANISNKNFEKIYLQHNLTGKIKSLESFSAADNSFKLTVLDEYNFPEEITAVLSSKFPATFYINSESTPELILYDDFIRNLEVGGDITIEALEDLSQNTIYVSSAFINY